MLQKIRDKATGWIAYVIIILIAIPFALWGLHEYFGGAGPLVAAEVNGVEIPVRTYQQEFQQQRRQLAEMFGGRIPAGLIDDQQLRENALQTLIRRELLAQVAQDRGYRVSPRLVAEEIRSIDVFHHNGQFDAARYTQVLEAQRLSKQQFESDVRYSLLLLQIEQALGYGAFLTRSEVAEYARLRDQTRRISYHTLPAQAFAEQVEITDASIEHYYTEHAQDFLTPERLRLSYIAIDPQSLEAQITITEEDLQRYYEQHSDRFSTPEERRVRHIVLSDEDAHAHITAQELRARLEDGEEFTDLAAAYSQDPVSASRGGDLGFLARGDMDPALDAISFTLPQGMLSQPVRVGNTWQLIEVVEIRPPQREPLEAVRDEITNDLRVRRAETRYIELTERLLTESFEQPSSLEPAADATGLPILQSDWLTRQGGEDLGAYAEVMRVAFSPDVLQEQRNSDLIDLPDGRSVVIRVHEHQPAQPRALDEVRDEILAKLTQQAKARLAQEAGEAAIAQMQAGTAPREVLATLPGSSVHGIEIRRDTSGLPPQLRQRAFTLGYPDADSPLKDIVSLSDGDTAILIIESVRDGVSSDPILADYHIQLGNLYRTLEAEAVLDKLERQAKITIYHENL